MYLRVLRSLRSLLCGPPARRRMSDDGADPNITSPKSRFLPPNHRRFTEPPVYLRSSSGNWLNINVAAVKNSDSPSVSELRMGFD